MANADSTQSQNISSKVTKHDVNRLLDLGRLLKSMLTPEEVEDLAMLLEPAPDRVSRPVIDEIR